MSATETGAGSARPERKAIAPAWHTCVLVAVVILLGVAEMSGSHTGPRPRALPIYLEAIVFEVLLAAYVYWGIRLGGNSLAVLVTRDRLTRYGRDALMGVAIWIVWYVVLSLVALGLAASGLTNAGAPGTIFPHGVVQIVVWIALAAITGFSEELTFRGYFLKQFSAWTGSTSAGVVMQAVLFGIGHIYLGWRQVVIIVVSGIFLGIFAVRLRNLRPLMVTHAWADIFGGVILHGLPY